MVDRPVGFGAGSVFKVRCRWWFGVGLGVRGGWATRFLTRIRPAEDSWPAGLARVVFGNLNENDTKQKFPRWFQGVFTETFLIVTGPYLGFLYGGPRTQGGINSSAEGTSLDS